MTLVRCSTYDENSSTRRDTTTVGSDHASIENVVDEAGLREAVCAGSGRPRACDSRQGDRRWRRCCPRRVRVGALRRRPRREHVRARLGRHRRSGPDRAMSGLVVCGIRMRTRRQPSICADVDGACNGRGRIVRSVAAAGVLRPLASSVGSRGAGPWRRCCRCHGLVSSGAGRRRDGTLVADPGSGVIRAGLRSVDSTRESRFESISDGRHAAGGSRFASLRSGLRGEGSHRVRSDSSCVPVDAPERIQTRREDPGW